MTTSVFDLFKIGIGPSSSHTVGPMKAAYSFVKELIAQDNLQNVSRLKTDLFGSLAATGKGHNTDLAVLLGLQGEVPDSVPIQQIPQIIADIRENKHLTLMKTKDIHFEESKDLIFHYEESLPYHPNGLRFTAYDQAQNILFEKIYYSIGGGFVISEEEILPEGSLPKEEIKQAYPFRTGKELLHICETHKLSISQVMMENEKAWRTEQEIKAGLYKIWDVMKECIDKGMQSEGFLPGGLNVKRRAKDLYEKLCKKPEANLKDPLTIIDWVNLYALAVNEENASGGRIVTAPTNGAAGVIPAVLYYYLNFTPNSKEEKIIDYFLAAGAIAIIFKENASFSGADVGCQGEIGSACSMAAGALTEAMGGTPAQVENAAEIGMEHNLGLTCDPIAGLVQIPCIERNAMASVKAINASRMALRGDGKHFVSLDNVIKTMKETGADMQSKYKETSRGGLAVNVVEC